jgi:hypothetical protein
MPTKIDPTVTMLKGQLSGGASKKGAEMIGKWEADLEKADWRGAKTIHANLASLRHQLESGSPDGAKIKELLTSLGEETERAAAHAGGDAAGVKSLGEALLQAAKSL